MVTRKKNSELTEEKILESALKLFSEQGYAGTPTSQIASQAEVSEGTVFKYFPKKMDLLRSVLCKFIEKYSAQIVIHPLEIIFEAHKHEPPKVILKAIILDRMALIDKMTPFLQVLLTEMQYHDELRSVFIDQVLPPVKNFGDKLFNTLIEEGYFRELPSLIPMRSFMGAVLLMSLGRKFVPELSAEGISLEEEIDYVLDIFLNGVMKAEVANE